MEHYVRKLIVFCVCRLLNYLITNPLGLAIDSLMEMEDPNLLFWYFTTLKSNNMKFLKLKNSDFDPIIKYFLNKFHILTSINSSCFIVFFKSNKMFF